MGKGRREVLTFEVEITDCQAVEGKTERASMILFSGFADCGLFKGRILPGGVDTQRQKAGGAPILSARYILEGVDCAGQHCRIFVENNGTAKEGAVNTVPRLITDSEALAWLEREELSGTVTPAKKGVTIHIFAGSGKGTAENESGIS